MHKDNITIRSAELSDARQIAELHIASWQYAYKGIIDQSYLDDRLDIDARTQRWEDDLNAEDSTTFLAFDGSVLAGFSTVGPSRDILREGYAELRSIYLNPEYFGQGVGQSLFQKAVKYNIEQGFTKMFANVLCDNKRARGFYEQKGALPIEDSAESVLIGGRSYVKMQYRWARLIP